MSQRSRFRIVVLPGVKPDAESASVLAEYPAGTYFSIVWKALTPLQAEHPGRVLALEHNSRFMAPGWTRFLWLGLPQEEEAKHG